MNLSFLSEEYQFEELAKCEARAAKQAALSASTVPVSPAMHQEESAQATEVVGSTLADQ